MVAQRHPHPVRVGAPFYRGDGATALHRYLDAEFIARYADDLREGRLALDSERAWEEEERFGGHDDHPTLRQPVHRCFYLTACEVACAQLGSPALDPAKIDSCGFVIRRLEEGGGESGWILERDVAVGWQRLQQPEADPDLIRRLRRLGVTPPQGNGPSGFSGEACHPLHPITTRDANGRLHTLLHGYLPVGAGSRSLPLDGSSPFDPDEEAKLAQELPWPFGEPAEGATWAGTGDALAVDEGRASGAMAALLQVLVMRYHVGEREGGENALLDQLCDRLTLFTPPENAAGYPEPTLADYAADHPLTEGDAALTLLGYLRARYGELVEWLDAHEEAPDTALPATAAGVAGWSLLVDEDRAAALRIALVQRLTAGLRQVVAAMPLPRFQQRDGDLYFVRPFVRTLDARGCERLEWGPASRPFRVAGPLDPEASRPSYIPMPSLKDLTRGLAQGAAFALPRDLAEKLNPLSRRSAAKDALDGDLPAGSNRLGLDWICSFSLPVITLVALILLMVFVLILNIVFWWLPWVKICFPIPSFSKEKS